MIEHLFYHLDLKLFLVNPNESKSCENIQYVFWNKHGVSSQCVTAPFRLQNWVWFPHSMFSTVENCYVPSMLIMFLFRIQSFVYQNIFLKVSQRRNYFFKPKFLTKNERMNLTLLLWYLRLTCFRSVFGRNWRRQKDISKLTDL